MPALKSFLKALFLFAFLITTLSACQGFLEDYDYKPVSGASSSGSY